MKQRDAKTRKPCRCATRRRVNPHDDATLCRYGSCVEFRCQNCSGYLGGWGPVGCKCGRYLRWARHPAMAPALDHAPVKPSRRPARLSRR